MHYNFQSDNTAHPKATEKRYTRRFPLLRNTEHDFSEPKIFITKYSDQKEAVESVFFGSRLHSCVIADVSEPRKLTHDDYTVDRVCVLGSKLNASKASLDEVHERLQPGENDENSYPLGRIGEHNFVIAFPA